MTRPMQVKYAHTDTNSNGGSHEEKKTKLFVGMLGTSTTEDDLVKLFEPFGKLKEVVILRTPNNVSRGCGFVKFENRQSALDAIDKLHQKITMPGSHAKICVKFADTEKEKHHRKMQKQLPTQQV